MELFRNAANKGFKFLQELDEPSSEPAQEDGAQSLETRLEGAADKLLSWAGSAAQKAGSVAQQIPGTGRLDDHDQVAGEDDAPGSKVLAEGAESAAAEGAAGAAGAVSDGCGSEAATKVSPVASPRPDPAEPNLDGERGGESPGHGETQPRHQALEYHYIGDEDEEATAQEQIEAEAGAGGAEAGAEEEAPSSNEDIPVLAAQQEEAHAGEASLPAAAQPLAEQLQPQRDRVKETPAQLQEDSNVQQRCNELERELQQAQERARERTTSLERRCAALEKELQQSQERCRKQESTLERQAGELEKERQQLERSREKAAAAQRSSADMERELKQHQERWLEKIKAAERREKEGQHEAQEKVAAASAERDAARTELARLRSELGAQLHGEEKSRQDLESSQMELKAKCQQLLESLRTSADVEMQLRGELANIEKSRAEIEQRCTDMAGQLERTQAAYDMAAAEVGSLSTRLHELEFGSKTDSGVEVVLRQQLDSMRERQSELEQRLKECSWMRDYALQQADEARAQLNVERAQTPAVADAPTTTESGVESAEVQGLRQEVEDLKTQIHAMIARHQDEMHQQALRSREEYAYLQRKSEEKDRRLEQLTCERNALRYESSESQARKAAATSQAHHSRDSLPDVEDNMQTSSSLAGQGPASEAVGKALSSGDAVLRRLTRLLYQSPLARRAFYSYILFLHIWIWVVLHRAAAAHSPHGA